MKHWPTKPLGEVCELVNGAPFKPSDWDGSGLPIVRIQNLNDLTKPFNYTSKKLAEKFRVRPGDTLLSWSGTPGTSFGCFRWDGPEGWLNQHIFNVHLGDEVLPPFFIYQVNSKLEEIIGKAHGGVGLQHITKGALSSVNVAVPPLAEQQRIVRLLDEADELRRLRATADKRTGELIPAVFGEMFGDPDLNPKGWLRIKVGDAVDLINGRAFKPTDWSKGGLPIIRIQNLRNSGAPFNFYDGEFEGKHQVKKGALLISWAGQLISFGVHIWDGPDGVLNQHIFKVEPLLDFEIPFLQHCLSYVVERAKSRFQGSEMKHLTRGTLDEAEIFAPPMSLQKEFSLRVAAIQEMEADQFKGRGGVDALFQSMLHRAFEGEL
jgi:type I restriction enzyme S subunit